MNKKLAVVATTLALAGTLAIAGCTPAWEYIWVKPGASQTEFQRTKFECYRDSHSLHSGNVFEEAHVYNECMESAGWVRKPKS